MTAENATIGPSRHLGPRGIGATLRRGWKRQRGRPAQVGDLRPDSELREDEPRVYLYDAPGEDRRISLRDVVVDQLTADQLLWIDVSADPSFELAATALGLAEETVAAITEPSHEPGLFVHDRYVHLSVAAPGEGDYGPEPDMLDCVVGSNWVLTVHRDPIEFLGHFHDQIRGDSALGRITSYGFLAAILQEQVSSYLAALRPIERELDRLDIRSMTGRANEDALLRELIGTRIRLAKLRRMLEPHRELFALLPRSEFAVLSGSTSETDFEALSELLERTLQSMESTRDMMVGSFDIYTTLTAQGTNKVMRRLTVASVTILPPTLIAGVMGMNSLPKALMSPVAFWITIAAMACLGLAVLTFARRRNWL